MRLIAASYLHAKKKGINVMVMNILIIISVIVVGAMGAFALIFELKKDDKIKEDEELSSNSSDKNNKKRK